jgi:hypothetical protein
MKRVGRSWIERRWMVALGLGIWKVARVEEMDAPSTPFIRRRQPSGRWHALRRTPIARHGETACDARPLIHLAGCGSDVARQYYRTVQKTKQTRSLPGGPKADGSGHVMRPCSIRADTFRPQILVVFASSLTCRTFCVEPMGWGADLFLTARTQTLALHPFTSSR